MISARFFAAMGPMITRCPSCDTELECTPEGRCWCMELPPLPITGDISALSCLCRRCLEERVRECEAARQHC